MTTPTSAPVVARTFAPAREPWGLGPFVTVIIPCRDERRYIGACLDSILHGDYPSARMEVIAADGMSEDGTRDEVARIAARDPRVRLVDNPGRTAPCALNAGIRLARGDVIVRMDAHCHYPPDYLRTLVGWLERSGADNVGGSCRTVPAGDGPVARAIAVALSHPLGVGNAQFRIGASEPRWVDTVPFGCWRRDVFERIGLFDEELARNQDDEFNHRLLGAGGRILLVPDVVTDYFARDTLTKLRRMYYQYGFFKPIVARKLGRVATLRQLAPPLLVLALALSSLLALVVPWGWMPFVALALCYGGACAAGALGAARRLEGPRRPVAVLALALCFPTMHLSYGAGYWSGLAGMLMRREPVVPDRRTLPVSR